MKTIENVTLYVCDFCKKKLQRKHAMINHEFHCSMNPKNIAACGDCAFLEERKETFDYQIGVDDFYTKESKTFFCTKLEKGLYPHKVVKMGLPEKYPETFEDQEQMPNKCKHWDC